MSSSSNENVAKDAPHVTHLHIHQRNVMLEVLRTRDSAFFEREGLTEFLNLDWDIQMDENLVREFFLNYNVKNRTVKMRGEEILIDDELMLEVFHLPRGDYKMPKKNEELSFVSSGGPSFTKKELDQGFRVTSCEDAIWTDRLSFLQPYLLLMPGGYVVPYRFIEFLRAEREDRNWFDAFMCFFRAIDLRSTYELNDSYVIKPHVSLLLAHIEKKKKLREAGPRQKEVTAKCQILKQGDDTNEAEEKERENSQDQVEEEQVIHPSLTISNVEDQILRHHDMERQCISELLNRVAALKSESEMRNSKQSEPDENRIANLRNQKKKLKKELEWCKKETELLKSETESLKNETEKWKRECGKAEQAREDLEAVVTTFCTTVSSRKLTRTLPEHTSSLGFATPALNKKLKISELPKAA